MNGDGAPAHDLARQDRRLRERVVDERSAVGRLHPLPAERQAGPHGRRGRDGSVKELRTFADDDPANGCWTAMSFFSRKHPATATARGARIWQVDLTGNAKLLREIPVDDGGSVTVVDRNQAIVTRKASSVTSA